MRVPPAAADLCARDDAHDRLERHSRTGAGSLSYEEWLRLYTAGAAYAGGQEHERVTLTPGKRPDLVVLQGPLDAEHPPRVAQTWVVGELAYSAG